MRFKLLVLVAIAATFLAALPAHETSAIGLKVAPLEYKATLKEDEIQRGFIDVSNPSAQSVTTRITVQAFRQIDDDGGLQFYDNQQISAGVKPELQTLDLGPREAARVFFTIDGKALPVGDVYAAVFFSTDPKTPTNGIGQSVKVGTLLSLVNKNPGSRRAEITQINLSFLQLSGKVTGTYSVKNTGPEGTGFYPKVAISSWPNGKTQQTESSLVFGGRERSNDFKYDIGFGIHRVEVGYGDSKKSQWVIAVPSWLLVVLLLISLIVAIELLLLKKRCKSHKKSAPKAHPSTPEK